MFRFSEIGRKVTALYVKYSIQWGMLQRTVFINKIKMLQRALAHDVSSLPVLIRASSLLSFLWFSYQFSSVILFASLAVKIFFK